MKFLEPPPYAILKSKNWLKNYTRFLTSILFRFALKN
nr:MAG TPA: hypothetical protein [Bacteriophage sp.]